MRGKKYIYYASMLAVFCGLLYICSGFTGMFLSSSYYILYYAGSSDILVVFGLVYTSFGLICLLLTKDLINYFPFVWKNAVEGYKELKR